MRQESSGSELSPSRMAAHQMLGIQLGARTQRWIGLLALLFHGILIGRLWINTPKELPGWGFLLCVAVAPMSWIWLTRFGGRIVKTYHCRRSSFPPKFVGHSEYRKADVFVEKVSLRSLLLPSGDICWMRLPVSGTEATNLHLATVQGAVGPVHVPLGFSAAGLVWSLVTLPIVCALLFGLVFQFSADGPFPGFLMVYVAGPFAVGAALLAAGYAVFRCPQLGLRAGKLVLPTGQEVETRALSAKVAGVAESPHWLHLRNATENGPLSGRGLWIQPTPFLSRRDRARLGFNESDILAAWVEENVAATTQLQSNGRRVSMAKRAGPELQ